MSTTDTDGSRAHSTQRPDSAAGAQPLRISLLTNMVAPYRIPLFEALAAEPDVQSLRVLTCVGREFDRQWQIASSTRDTGYQVHRLGGITLNLRRGAGGVRILHLRFGIFWELLRNRPDRLIVGDASWTSFLAGAACRILGISYIVWNEITTSSRASSGIAAKLRRWLYKAADSFIASGQLARDFLIAQGCPSRRIHIAQNAVDNTYYLSQRDRWLSARPSLRRNLGILPAAFTFLFVGQLIPRKRVRETLMAVAALGNERPVHLLLAGTGSEEVPLRALATKLGYTALDFCGYADGDRLSQLYTAADAVMLLSDDEPWGMVVNEALLFCKPVVTTSNVGASEIVGTFGKLVKPDLSDLPEALRDISAAIPHPNQANAPPTPASMAAAFLKAMRA